MTRRLLCVVVLLLPCGPTVAVEPAPGEEDVAVLRRAGVDSEGPALLDYLRKRTPTDADRARIADLVHQLGDLDFARREEASARLQAMGSAATPALREARKDRDLEIRRRARDCEEAIEHEATDGVTAAVVRLIGLRRPDGAVTMLLAFGPTVTEPALADEVLAALLQATPDGRVAPEVLAALESKEPFQRGVAAVVVGRRGTPEQRRLLDRLEHDPSARVRLRAAMGLLAARDPAAVPRLVALVGEAEVSEEADATLRLVADRQSPEWTSGATAADRARTRAGWEAWWKQHGPQINWKEARVELAWLDPQSQVRAAAREFLTALTRGDLNGLRRQTGSPFLIGGLGPLAAPQLEPLLQELSRMSARELLTFRFLNTPVQPIDEYARHAPDDEKKFLASNRDPGRWAVYVSIGPRAGKQETGALLICRQEGRYRVFGIGQGKPTPIGGK